MAGDALSYTRAPDLPLFERPPVTEVKMGVTFEGVKLRATDLGELHRRFSDNYPMVEEHPPAPVQIERFGRASKPGIEFQFLDIPPIPMVVFLADDRASLVQVQDNQFNCAWRRVRESTTYPKYESFRTEFLQNARIFNSFAEDIRISDLPVTQAEITYVNDIPVDGHPRPDALSHILPSLSTIHNSTEAMPNLATISIDQRFTFRTAIGVEYARMHISSEPLFTDSDAIRLSLTYRGEPSARFPTASGIEMMMEFFDEGHDRIVREFAANTTIEAQNSWGRVV